MCIEIETYIQTATLLVAIVIGYKSIKISNKVAKTSTLNDFISIYNALDTTNILNLIDNNLIDKIRDFNLYYKKQIDRNGRSVKPTSNEFKKNWDIMDRVFTDFVLIYHVAESSNLSLDDFIPILYPDIKKYCIITEGVLEYMKRDERFRDGIIRYTKMREKALEIGNNMGLKHDKLTL